MIFTLSIATPYLPNIFVLKFEIVFNLANSLDPDQTLHFVASDQGLHCRSIISPF